MTDPVAETVAPVAASPRKVVAMRAGKSFTGSSAMDRMKAYLKDVPVLHQRLTSVVAALEDQLAQGQKNCEAARKTLSDFNATTSQIKATVARWEEEQHHVGPGNVPAATGEPISAAVPAPSDPAGGETTSDPSRDAVGGDPGPTGGHPGPTGGDAGR